jgi:hypothetical protein
MLVIVGIILVIAGVAVVVTSRLRGTGQRDLSAIGEPRYRLGLTLPGALWDHEPPS